MLAPHCSENGFNYLSAEFVLAEDTDVAEGWDGVVLAPLQGISWHTGYALAEFGTIGLLFPLGCLEGLYRNGVYFQAGVVGIVKGIFGDLLENDYLFELEVFFQKLGEIDFLHFVRFIIEHHKYRFAVSVFIDIS